ncbi:MAG: hypothetical protein ABSA54_21775 [Terriglobales bacterium]
MDQRPENPILKMQKEDHDVRMKATDLLPVGKETKWPLDKLELTLVLILPLQLIR